MKGDSWKDIEMMQVRKYCGQNKENNDEECGEWSGIF